MKNKMLMVILCFLIFLPIISLAQVIDSQDIVNDASTYASSVNVGTDMYAMTYRSTALDCQLFTFEALNNGTVTPTPIDTLLIDSTRCDNQHLFEIEAGLYGFVYENATNPVYLMTVNISSDGTINGVIDSLNLSEGLADYPRAETIYNSGNENIIAYGFDDDSGRNTTIGAIGVLDNGTISGIKYQIKKHERGSAIFSYPDFFLVEGSSDKVGMVWNKAATGATSLDTFTVLTNGTVSGFIEDDTSLGTLNGIPTVHSINNSAYVVVGRDNLDQPEVSTFSVLSDGTYDTSISTWEADTTSSPLYMGVAKIHKNAAVVVYEYGSTTYAAKTIGIEEDGSLNTSKSYGPVTLSGAVDNGARNDIYYLGSDVFMTYMPNTTDDMNIITFNLTIAEEIASPASNLGLVFIPTYPDDDSYLGFNLSFDGQGDKIWHEWYYVSWEDSANGTNFENMTLFVTYVEDSGPYTSSFEDRFIISPGSTTELDSWQVNVTVEFDGSNVSEINSSRKFIGGLGSPCESDSACPGDLVCGDSGFCEEEQGGGGSGGSSSTGQQEQAEFVSGNRTLEDFLNDLFNLEELVIVKRECSISVAPSVMNFDDDNKLVKVTIRNNDIIDYSPGINFIGEKGTRIKIASAVSDTAPGESVDFGAKYVGQFLVSEDVGTASMVLSHEECADIVVPINVNISEPPSLFELIWDFLTYPVSSRLPFFKGWMLTALVGGFFLWLFFLRDQERRKRVDLPTRIGQIGLFVVLTITASAMLSLFINIGLQVFPKDYILFDLRIKFTDFMNLALYLVGITAATIPVLFIFPRFANQKRNKVFLWIVYSVLAVTALNFIIHINNWLAPLVGTIVSTTIVFMMFAKQATRKRELFMCVMIPIIAFEVVLFIINQMIR